MQQVLQITALAVAFLLSTYSFSRALWLLGIRGKEKSFKKLWAIVCSFAVSMVAAGCFIALAVSL